MRISYLQTMVGKFQPPYAGAKETVDYDMTELEILVKFQNIDSSNFLSPNTSKSISTTGMTDMRKTVQNRSEALLALPSNAANKKNKTTKHNASSSSFLAVDTPTVNNPMEDSTATAEQTSDSHNDNNSQPLPTSIDLPKLLE